MNEAPAGREPASAARSGRDRDVVVRRALPTEPAVRGARSLFLAEAEDQGIVPDRRMLFVGTEHAPAPVAGCLGLRAGDEVIARRKLLLADGVPVRVATSYFRVDLFGGTRLAAPGFVQPSLQTAIEALGYAFGHAEETLTARPATLPEIDTLDLDPGDWVVEILRVSHSTEGSPVHALETICAARRHVFTITQIGTADEF